MCTKCGAPLYKVAANYPGSEREHYRRMEGECFGLPNGGLIASIVFGIIIILAGISLYLDVSGINVGNWFWPAIIIIFGVLIVAGGLYRQRRYSKRTSPST
jgi:hypothetical protein